MSNIILSCGSFSFIWLYLILISGIQSYLHNKIFEKYFYLTVGFVLAFWILFIIYKTRKYLNFKLENTRNNGLFKFKNIVQNRKVGLDFVLANFVPLIDMNIFEIITIEKFINKLIIIAIMFAIVNYSRNFSFNPILSMFGYRLYNSKDESEKILLIKIKDYGNKPEYQEKFLFEEFDNTEIYILKEIKNE